MKCGALEFLAAVLKNCTKNQLQLFFFSLQFLKQISSIGSKNLCKNTIKSFLKDMNVRIQELVSLTTPYFQS